MYPPLASNQRVEVGPAPSRVPPSWSPAESRSCVLPPLAKRRADLHEPPPWFQSESRVWSGSKPCTPLLVSKQRVEPAKLCTELLAHERAEKSLFLTKCPKLKNSTAYVLSDVP